jgi:hypothetical protein
MEPLDDAAITDDRTNIPFVGKSLHHHKASADIRAAPGVVTCGCIEATT